MIFAAANDVVLTAIAAVGGASGVAALIRAFTIDPRAARLAERRQRDEMQAKIDDLYREKRQAEERERVSLRRIEDQDVEIRGLKSRVASLEGQVDMWRERALGGPK